MADKNRFRELYSDADREAISAELDAAGIPREPGGGFTLPEAAAADVAAVSARPWLLAEELARLGIPAEPVTGHGRAGVWLAADDAELAVKVLAWATAHGLIITREHFREAAREGSQSPVDCDNDEAHEAHDHEGGWCPGVGIPF